MIFNDFFQTSKKDNTQKTDQTSSQADSEPPLCTPNSRESLSAERGLSAAGRDDMDWNGAPVGGSDETFEYIFCGWTGGPLTAHLNIPHGNQ